MWKERALLNSIVTEEKVMESSRKFIGEMLLKAGEITQEQLDEALEAQKIEGGRLGVILIRRGYISSDIMAEYLTKQTADTITRFKKESQTGS